MCFLSTDFRGISSQAALRLLRYSTFRLTTAPLHLRSAIFLHIQDGLLSKEDEQLPFSGHVVGSLKEFHFIQDFVSGMFMGAQEVIVSYPEGKVIVGTVDAVESVCVSVRSFISTVQPFDHLFERTVLCRYSVVVGKSNDLSDGKSKIFSILFGEFHCSKRVGAVAIRNELKVFRQFCESAESHAHGEDTRTNARLSDT